jgi:hypothetical protein
MTDPKHTAFVAGLRSVADLFESRDDLPLPLEANNLAFYVRSMPEALALHALMGKPTVTRETGAFPVRINGTLAGMRAVIAIHADVALSTGAPALPALVPALAALIMNPVKLASVGA